MPNMIIGRKKNNGRRKKGGLGTGQHASTFHLTRIKVYLQEIETPVTKSQISVDCGILGHQVNDALNYLINNKEVLAIKTNGQTKYTYNRKILVEVYANAAN